MQRRVGERILRRTLSLRVLLEHGAAAPPASGIRNARGSRLRETLSFKQRSEDRHGEQESGRGQSLMTSLPTERIIKSYFPTAARKRSARRMAVRLILVLPLLLLPCSACTRIFLEIGTASQSLGRLIFHLDTSLLPKHAENIRLLCSEERIGVDAALTYRGCAFDHSPAYVEGAQYKWAHILKGRGRNALENRPRQPIRDGGALSACAVACVGGGKYYGVRVEDEGAGVVLTTPISGPGSGFTRLAIVRVGESPPSWRQVKPPRLPPPYPPYPF